MRTVAVLLVAALSAVSCSSGAPSGTPADPPPSSAVPTTGPGEYAAPVPIATTCSQHLAHDAVADRFGKPTGEPRVTSNESNVVSCSQSLTGAEYPVGYVVTDIVFEVDIEKTRARYQKAKDTTDPEIGDVQPLPGYGDQAYWLRHGDAVGARPGQFQVRVQRGNVLITVRVAAGQTASYSADRTNGLRDATAKYAEATLNRLPKR
ncbi:hypothetical protein AB0I60_07510 [Actinosynnema sp. NPDC050436]|uniref:hypothetical protein n=1 Tax=Actinosynnema sp. NPDC050436 TaxID=3155659 RepID=UPI00340FA9BD